MSDWDESLSTTSTKMLLFWLAVSLCASYSPVTYILRTGNVSWVGIAIGLVVAVPFLTQYGNDFEPLKRFNEWWLRIGIGGRAAVIIVFVLVYFTLVSEIEGLQIPVMSLSVTVFACMAVGATYHLLKRTMIRGRQSLRTH